MTEHWRTVSESYDAHACVP